MTQSPTSSTQQGLGVAAIPHNVLLGLTVTALATLPSTGGAARPNAATESSEPAFCSWESNAPLSAVTILTWYHQQPVDLAGLLPSTEVSACSVRWSPGATPAESLEAFLNAYHGVQDTFRYRIDPGDGRTALLLDRVRGADGSWLDAPPWLDAPRDAPPGGWSDAEEVCGPIAAPGVECSFSPHAPTSLPNGPSLRAMLDANVLPWRLLASNPTQQQPLGSEVLIKFHPRSNHDVEAAFVRDDAVRPITRPGDGRTADTEFYARSIAAKEAFVQACLRRLIDGGQRYDTPDALAAALATSLTPEDRAHMATIGWPYEEVFVRFTSEKWMTPWTGKGLDWTALWGPAVPATGYDLMPTQ